MVDEEAGERVTQVVQSDVSETRPAPDAIPGIEQGCERMAAERRWEDVLAALHARDRLQQRDGCPVERDRSGLAGFRHWHQQRAPLPVHMLPFGVGNFVTPAACEQQQFDRLGCASVLVLVDGGDKPLRFVGSQKPLPVNLRGHAETCGGVHDCARHVPLSREIEDTAQEHQDAIAGPSGISLGAHVVDQSRDVLARNQVEGETTESRQDVDAQDCFVGGPTSLAGLGVGQVAVADELVERRDGPQFLAASLRVGTKRGLGEAPSGPDVELARPKEHSRSQA